MMIKLTLSEKKLCKKTMSKKAWASYCRKDRKPSMGRPAVFRDKRYSEKYKFHSIV